MKNSRSLGRGRHGGSKGRQSSSCFPNVEPSSSFSMLKNVWNIGRVLRVCPASSTLRVVGRMDSRGGIDICLIIFTVTRFTRSTHVDVYLYFLLAIWKFIIHTRKIEVI